MIQTAIRRCTVLILVLSLSIGSVAVFADTTDLIRVQQHKVTDNTLKFASSAEPTKPPTIGDAIVDVTRDSALSPTSTAGGAVIGKGLDFLESTIGEADQINASINKAGKGLSRLLEKKGNIEKALTKLKSGSKAWNRTMRALNKNAARIASNKSRTAGLFGKLRKIKGLKLAGAGMSIYGIYTDSDALLKGEYKHNHSSMRFVRDSVLGSNIAINGFLLTPWGQVPVIKQGGQLFALGVGVTKDFVTSDTFAKYMNNKNNRFLDTADEIIDNTNAYWTETFDGWITDWYKYTGVYPSEAQLAKAKEQHRKWLESRNKGLGRKPGDNIGAYKPNIYLYTEVETSIRVTFEMPGLLQTVIPEYPGQWLVTGYPDGSIKGADGEIYTYLFYESITWPCLYQTDEGWLIQADNRSEQMESIMLSYGFTEQETADFIEYWTVKLDSGEDYAMYPQLTSTVDIAMPMTIDPKPDCLFRLWFAFEKEAVPYAVPTSKYIKRKGFTVVEWGGVILP